MHSFKAFLQTHSHLQREYIMQRQGNREWEERKSFIKLGGLEQLNSTDWQNRRDELTAER